jgi:effector-binding domain-containing protein
MDEVQIVVRRAEPYVGITASVPMAGIPALADRFPELFAHLAAHEREPAGPPFFRYHVIDMERELVVEIGVPTGTPIDGAGEIVPGELPAGRYAAMTHVGAPDTLVAATADLLAWAAAEQLAST